MDPPLFKAFRTAVQLTQVTQDVHQVVIIIQIEVMSLERSLCNQVNVSKSAWFIEAKRNKNKNFF